MAPRLEQLGPPSADPHAHLTPGAPGGSAIICSGLPRGAGLPLGDPALAELLGPGWPAAGLVELRGRGRSSLALLLVRACQSAGSATGSATGSASASGAPAASAAGIPGGLFGSGARRRGASSPSGSSGASPHGALPVAWIDGAGRFCPSTAGVDLDALSLVRPVPVGVGPGLSGGNPNRLRVGQSAQVIQNKQVAAIMRAGDVGGVESPSSKPLAGRGPLRAHPMGVVSEPGAQQAEDSCAPACGAPRQGPGGRSRPRAPAASALFAADVLLRSRAFALVVLDMPAGPGSPGHWFRLGRLATRARSLLLVLHDQPRPVAGSAADLSLAVRLQPLPGPPWADLPPPRLEVTLTRHRGEPARQGRRVSLLLA